MTNWLLRWVASAAALAVVAGLHIGVEVGCPHGHSCTLADKALVLAEATVVIGLLNSLVRPVLSFLTMPINCLTFGLFGFVLNALLFYSVQYLVPGFRTTGLLPALIGSVLMGLISGLLSAFLPDRKPKD